MGSLMVSTTIPGIGAGGPNKHTRGERCCEVQTVYAFVEGAPGEHGEQVDVRCEGGKFFALVHRDLLADPDHMFRLLSVAVTRHVTKEWMHVGSVVDVA